MRSIHATSIAILLAAGGILASCTVQVVDDDPKGGCVYISEGNAACKTKVTQSECQQHGGTWSRDLKECPKD